MQDVKFVLNVCLPDRMGKKATTLLAYKPFFCLFFFALGPMEDILILQVGAPGEFLSCPQPPCYC